MSTDLVLDLFKRTPEDEAKRKKSTEGPAGQKNILSGLEDLPTEGEYDSLDLSSFLKSK
jgi:TATA-binding protein-associated factor